MSDTYLNTTGLAYYNAIIQGKIDERLPYYTKTTAQWNSQSSLVAQKDVLYIYTDHKTITKNNQTFTIPGFKIGDGLTYLIDMPFINVDEETFLTHINDTTSHITAAERSAWNDKVRCFLDTNNNEILVFTTN